MLSNQTEKSEYHDAALVVGNDATNDTDVTKQSGHAVSKTDIDDRDNSNRTYQYKAVLLHEFISVEVSLIHFHIIKFSRLCVHRSYIQSLGFSFLLFPNFVSVFVRVSFSINSSIYLS